MNKKLIFRILGAISSALIIVSVFLPYISVVGYTRSLWDLYDNSIYFPILLIIFGVIGVVFFALNIKTEFAYMTSGAVLFFAITGPAQTISDGLFKTLGMGYYLIFLGAILTGVMAFLLNMKEKPKKVDNSNGEAINNSSNMLNQIDKLYDSNMDLNNQIKTIEPVSPTPAIEPVAPITQNPIPSSIPVMPISNDSQVAPIPVQPIQNSQDVAIGPQNSAPIEQVNPVVQSFDQPILNLNQGLPSNSQIVNNINNNQQVANKPNPVVNDLMQPSGNLMQSNNTVNNIQSTPNVSNIPMANSVPNQGQVDIFGQPINKQ